jgi:branched-chain amino acid transport system ATP-binding protein
VSTAVDPAGPAELTENAVLLDVRDLDVRYGEARAVSGVSFDIPAGRICALLGPNGAGKSTCARAISGLVGVHGGSVVLAGRDVTALAAPALRRAGVLYLPEGRAVFPTLTVTENLRLAVGVLPRRSRNEAVERAFELFPSLAARRRQQAGRLSGGEQQMLSLSRALALNPPPRLVIADELSLGLAPKMVGLVFDNLSVLRKSGTSILLIEQFVHRALQIADSAVVLSRGTVRWSGPAADAGDDLLRHYLGDSAVGG